MSTERKPQAPKDEARMEKQVMDQPQEEFVGDEARPSKDVSEVRSGNAKKRKFEGEKAGS